MTIFKIATMCILTAGTLAAFLSTGFGSDWRLSRSSSSPGIRDSQRL